MSNILESSAFVERMLTKAGLEPKPAGTWVNPNKIVYHFFNTNRGLYVVKFDVEYFRFYGRIFKEECMLGDSFDAHVVDNYDVKVFIAAKADGIFQITRDKLLAHAHKRDNNSTRTQTYSFGIDHYTHLK